MIRIDQCLLFSLMFLKSAQKKKCVTSNKRLFCAEFKMPFRMDERVNSEWMKE